MFDILDGDTFAEVELWVAYDETGGSGRGGAGAVLLL